MKTKNSSKTVIYLILALAWPLVYKGLNKLWVYFVFNLNGVDLLPDNLRTHLLTNPFSFDAIFCVLMILITIPLLLKIRKPDKENIPQEYVKKMNFKWFLLCVVIALGLAGVSSIYQLVVRQLMMGSSSVAESVKEFDQTFQSSTTMASYIWAFLSIALFGPIVEELVFRGVLFSGVNKYLPGIWAVILTSLYFGVWHGNIMQKVYTSLLGLGFGLAYAATRNLWFPVTIHLVNNMLSQLPPALENNDTVVMTMIVLRFVAVIPMIYILYRMCKNNPALNWKNSEGMNTAVKE